MIYRSMWISDMHLGARDCRAGRLLDFLRRHEREHLYLVGDIFDGWSLRKSWYWERTFNDVLRTIVYKSQHVTNVVYIPGNHDEFARDFVYMCVGDATLRDRTIHETVDGRRFLVPHGDEFDDVIQHARWLANSRDWVESCTALVEHFDGRLEIIRYADVDKDTHRERWVAEGNAYGGDGLSCDVSPTIEWAAGDGAPDTERIDVALTDEAASTAVPPASMIDILPFRPYTS
ncbi:MAG: UDP-2,3-diacylglucosamine diphosphatase [Rhodothermales bacterium]